MKPFGRWPRSFSLALLLVGAGVFIGFLAAAGRGSAGLALAGSIETAPPDSGHSVVRAFSQEVRRIAASVRPGVVQIEVRKKAVGGRPFHGDEFYDFFRRFLRPGPNREVPPPGNPEGPEEEFRERGMGSGFIVGPEGYVLTNHHVVDRADRIRIRLGDGREFDAKLIGSDPLTDVAVLQILKGERLAVVPLGDSSQLEVGDFVLAVGSPFGFTQTVTSGIVSALGRNVDPRELGQDFYQDFIQTDAAINPGNSGGPLINDQGRVVGINSMIFTQGVAQNAGVGLAIPINLARDIMGSILKHGKVVRGQLGIKIKDLTPDLGESLGLPAGTRGVLVMEVLPNTPAEKAGLRNDDVIIKFNAKETESASQLRILVSTSEVGKESKLEIFRDKARMILTVKVGELKGGEGSPSVQVRPRTETSAADLLGLNLSDIDEKVAGETGLRKGSGVVVVGVSNPEGPGAAAGLRPGDVILEVDRHPIRSVSDLSRILKESKKGAKLLVRLQRGDSKDLIVIRLPD